MKATLKIKLGSKVLELHGEGTGKQMVKSFAFWANLPEKCGNCNDSNITLNYKSPKGNDYYGLKCLQCNAELNFGQHKQGDSFFLRWDDKWEVWEPDKDGKKSNGNGGENQDAEPPDDIEF